MSGREFAFDQRMIFDLNKHLRQVASDDRQDAGPSPTRALRPDASVLIDAVSRAAASLNSNDARIRHLEDRHVEVQDLAERMKAKLADMLRLQQTTEATARSEAERADRAEARAEQLQSRVQALEADLDAALADLHRIADVITDSLLTKR